MLPDDKIFCIVCSEEDFFLAPILTTYGYNPNPDSRGG